MKTTSGSAARTSLPRRVQGTIFWRSLGLQACFNPQRMQNLGLMVALAPWLRWRRPALPLLRRFCLRHYEYFNTNPYFANFVIGGILRLEDANLHEGGRQNRLVHNFKSSLARAFASLGDQLFWLGLRPTLLLLGCLLGWSGRVWPPLIVVGLFGLGQLLLRWHAIGTGYRLGLDIVELLSHPGWHRAIWAAQRAGLVLGGWLGGVYLGGLSAAAPGREATIVPGVVLATAASLVLLRRRVPGELILLLAIPLALVLAGR